MLSVVLSETDKQELEREGLNVSVDALDAACQHYAGRSIEELAQRFDDQLTRKDDHGLFRGLFEPKSESDSGGGPTNNVLCDMNEARDRHAVEVIRQAKQTNQTIMVTAGGSHVLTWEKAVRKMYTRDV